MHERDATLFAAGLLAAIKPSIRRTVHSIKPTSGKHRPAIVVDVFGDRPDGRCTLQVFTGGSNDGFHSDRGTLWATSIHRDYTLSRPMPSPLPECTRKALSIAHVMRERIGSSKTVRENTPPPQGLEGVSPTNKAEAVTIRAEADEEEGTTKTPAGKKR